MDDLDKTLSVADEIELGIFPDISEAAKKNPKGRYPNLPSSAFADPENRAFPIDTAEHCRAGMVYLNKYYNNPGKGGVCATYSKAKFKTVHDRILKAMKKFGIEHGGCAICGKNKAKGTASNEEKNLTETKGGEEKMDESSEEINDSTEETSAENAPEEQNAEETEEIKDEVSDEEEAPSEEEVAPEQKVEEKTSEESASEEEEVEDSLSDKLKAIVEDVIKTLEPEKTEVAASEPTNEIDMLSEELAKTKAELESYKIKEVGASRIAALKEAGIEFKDSETDSRTMRLGKMSTEEFEAYASDLASVAIKPKDSVEKTEASVKEDVEVVKIPTPSVFLPIIEDPAVSSRTEEFKNIYKS